MKTNTRFTFNAVQFDKDNEVHLVVSLTAPPLSLDKKRPPICIIPVIDISGSMAHGKLDYAKKSAMKLVEQLQPGDYGGLVSFSDHGRVDYFPVEMTQARKEELRVKIGQLHVEGGTNLCDGMMKAVEAAKRLDLSASVITRVILLTDGQPTHGIAKDAKSLRELLSKTKGHVTLSAFGYGSDPDHALLGDLAQEAAGNYAHIENPDNALAAFGKELGGLLSTYAQGVEVEITPSNGHVITEVLSDLTVEEEVDGQISVKIPSILAEETNNVVVAVKLSAQKQHGPRAVNVLDVKVTYETLGDDGVPVKKVEESKAKIQFVRPEDAEKAPLKEVDAIVVRAQLVKAQIEAEKAAGRGDFQAAGQVFVGFAAAAASRGHEDVIHTSAHIGSNFLNSQVYAARGGNRRALRNATARGVGVSGLAAEDAAVLRSANYSLDTSTQAASSEAFTGPVNPVATPVATPVGHVDIGTLGAGAGSWTGSLGASSSYVVPGVPAVVPPDPPPVVVTAPASARKLAKTQSKRW